METPDTIGQIRQLLPIYKKRKQQAIGFIREAFSIASRPYLALSGGKDGVAMLALVNQVANELRQDFVIWSHVSDASFPGTVEVIEQCAEIAGRELILDESPVSAYDVIRDAVRPFGKSGYFFDAIKSFVDVYKADLAFVGVRASESNRRRRAVKIHKHLFESHTAGHRWICYPLAWMDVEDVFGVAIEYGYPIHPIYYKIHPSGNCRNIRLGYTTAQDLLDKGSMVFIRQNYPDIFNRLIAASDNYARFV